MSIPYMAAAALAASHRRLWALCSEQPRLLKPVLLTALHSAYLSQDAASVGRMHMVAAAMDP